MNSIRITFSTAAVLTLAAATPRLVSQDLGPSRVPGSASGAPAAIARSTGVARLADGVVAGGRDYEAVFRRGAVEMLPALGSRAPEPLPFRFELETILRGDEILLSTAGAAVPEPEHDGRSVSFARGKVATERYDVRSEGLEQSFVFATRLPGQGDLIVRGRVATALVPEAGADGSIRFLRPGIGGIRYGKVTGVDGRGRRVAGSLRLHGEVLDLVLPAAFVDGAAYPLVLDPLIGTEFAVGNGAYDDTECDVAFDETAANYLVVWKRKFSIGYSLIRGQLLNGGGALFGNTIFFVSAANPPVEQLRARVADVNQRDRFVVVWQQLTSPGSPSSIHGATVDAATGATSNVVALVADANSNADPCLAGEASTVDNEALLVWRRGSDVLAVQVTVPAAGDPSVFGAVTSVASSFNQVTALAVSKSGGSHGRLVVVIGYYPLVVSAQVIDRQGLLLGAPLQLQLNPIAACAVDGDGTDFLVARASMPLSPSVSRVSVQRLNWNGAALSMVGGEAVLDHVGGSQKSPDVCYLGTKYAVFWTREAANFGDDVVGYVVDPDGTPCGSRIVLDGLGVHNRVRQFAPRCIGRRDASTAPVDQGLVVFSDADVVPPFGSDLVGQLFEAVGAGSPPVIAGPGCGAGGIAGISGAFAIGSTDFGFTLTGAESTAAVFFSLALPGPTLGCSPCTLTTPVAFELTPNIRGQAFRAGPSTCDPTYLGLTLEFQWVSVNTSTSPCLTLPTMATSQRLQVTLSN